MRLLASMLVVALLAMPAHAQWFARGEFNGWSLDHPMTDLGGGHFSTTVAGLTPGSLTHYKIASEDWSQNAPGSDGRVMVDANGEITFHFYTEWEPDNWNPAGPYRVGYDDPGHGWDLPGTMNGWDTGIDWHLTDMGGGLFTGTFEMPQGFHEFKFRKSNDWDISIGGDFGNAAGNNQIFVNNTGEEWTFTLDLPNGRWLAEGPAAPSQPGDFNLDGLVDARDYVVWRKNPVEFGEAAGYQEWRGNFGGGVTVLPGWFARGEFNNWSLDHQMNDLGDGVYSVTISGLDPGVDFDYKIANSNFSESYPGSNGQVRSNSSGEITLNFFERQGETWDDAHEGWGPSGEYRVGYEDHGLIDWEIIGSWDDWAGDDPYYFLSSVGDGVYSGAFQFFAGEYEFKFREQGIWNTSIGDDFGNAAANNMFTVLNHGDTWVFELDLPNGRWRVYDQADPPMSGSALAAVPEPGSLMLAIVGAMLVGAARRRRPAAANA